MLSEAQRELAIARIFADTPAAVTATEASTFKLVLKALRSPVNIVCTIAYIIDNMCMQGVSLTTLCLVRDQPIVALLKWVPTLPPPPPTI